MPRVSDDAVNQTKSLFSSAFMKRKYPTGSLREVLSIAVPLVISNSAFMVMQFCDRVFLANYSELSIQAAVPAGNLAFTLICLFTATAGYSANLVAQYHGAKKALKCLHATMQGIYFTLMFMPLVLLAIPLGNFIISLFGHTPELALQEGVYLKWMVFCALPVGLGWSISGFFTGQGRVKMTTISNIIGSALNIVLDYVLIFGKFGFPEMGLEGAAIATFIASFFAPATQFFFMMKSRHVREVGLRDAFRPEFKLMKKLVRFGFPAGVQIFLDHGAWSLFLLVTAMLDAVSLTVSNIVLSINNLAFSPVMGFGTAASILCGQYLGSGDSANAKKAVRATMKLGLIHMCLIGSVFVLLPETLISLFATSDGGAAHDPEFMRMGRNLMYLMTIWGFFDTVNLILVGGLKGSGDTKFTMWYLALVAWLVWIPGEVLILKAGGGIVEAWVWMTIYVGILSTGLIKRWHGGIWKQIRMVH